MNECAVCIKGIVKKHKSIKRLALLERCLACEPRDYYEPREIYFCQNQIIWLITNIQVLHEFKWVGGLDIDIPKRQKPSGRGYFETPADYAYEVERRLWHCGRDGLLTYLHYGYDFRIEDLAKFISLSEKAIKHHIEVVIWRISGWNFYGNYPYRFDHHSRDYQNWQSRQK